MEREKGGKQIEPGNVDLRDNFFKISCEIYCLSYLMIQEGNCRNLSKDGSADNR